MLLSQKILNYFQSISPDWKLPKSVNLIYPFDQADTWSAMEQFYNKYYQDQKTRHLIVGINPGRLGAGVTGIPFTDPIHLMRDCKIQNDFRQKHELSSQYVYELINSYGGATKFYEKFYISSVCPLGFTKDGINYNYYDDKKLYQAVEKYIVKYIEEQLAFPLNREVAFCWGKGKNYKFLDKLNQKHQWFKKLVPQPHPRWIMQYRRKTLDEHKNGMLLELNSI